MPNEKIEARLKKIGKNLHSEESTWGFMQETSKELYSSLREYKIIRKIVLNPNDLYGGSINIHPSTLPEDMSMKVWHESGNYYMSFFRNMEGMFEQQVTGIFKDNDIVTMPDLDKFEEMFLDYCANEIYNRDNKTIIQD